jgi:hypothetical protein
MRSHTHADSQFDVTSEVEIKLPKPYRKDRPKKLNCLGIPEKPFYRAGDAAQLLECTVALVLWRFRTGKYKLPPQTDSCGRRIFTLEDLQSILSQTSILRRCHSRKKELFSTGVIAQRQRSNVSSIDVFGRGPLWGALTVSGYGDITKRS